MTLPNRKLPMAESKLMKPVLRLVEAAAVEETMTAGDATIMKTAKARVRTMATATNAEVEVVAAEEVANKSQKTKKSRNKPGKSVSLSRLLLPRKRLETAIRLVAAVVVAAIVDNATMMAMELLGRMVARRPMTSASTTNTAKTRSPEGAAEVAVAVAEAAKEAVIISKMLMETKMEMSKERTAETSKTVGVVAAKDVEVIMEAVAEVVELVVAIDAVIIKKARQMMVREPLVTIPRPT